MNIHIMRWFFALLVLVTALGASGCQSNAMAADQVQIQRDLGQEFIDELSSTILPNLEDREHLRKLGVMLSEEEIVKDMSAFDAFMQAWEAGEDSVLTVVFCAQKEVYARYQWKDGKGYYFRCEASEESGGRLEAVCKVFEDIQLISDENLGKLQFKLLRDKEDVATFTFRSAAVPEEGAEGAL